MNKHTLSISLLLLSFIVAGCSGQEGTAEQVGKKIDESVDSSKQAIDEAIDKAAKKIEELGNAAEGPAEQTGEKIDESMESLFTAVYRFINFLAHLLRSSILSRTTRNKKRSR